MSETLHQMTLFDDADESTCSAVGFPAKTCRSLAKVKGSAENVAASGGRCSDLSADSDPLGCLLRTSLLSELAALTTYSVRWNRKATPAGRPWWVRGPSERRTEGTESGLWPTPGASKASSDTTLMCSGDGRTTPNKLGWAAVFWSTPRACDADKAGSPREKQRGDLQAQCRWWATPLASDWRSTKASEATMAKGGRPLREQVGQLDRENRSTHGNRPGLLNPLWVLQLMGYPVSWFGRSQGFVSTDSEQSATP